MIEDGASAARSSSASIAASSAPAIPFAELPDDPFQIGRRGRRDRHVHPRTAPHARSAGPARTVGMVVDARRIGKHLVDAEGTRRDGEVARLEIAHADGRCGNVVETGGDRRAFRESRRLRGFGGDCAGTRGRLQNDRQRRLHLLQPEERQHLAAVVLAVEIGEGGAGLRQVRRDLAGQAETQPVLAEERMPDRRVTLGIVPLDPGEQACGGIGIGMLAGQRQRLVQHAGGAPGGDDAGRPAVERQHAAAERPAIAVEAVEPVAMAGHRDAGDGGAGEFRPPRQPPGWRGRPPTRPPSCRVPHARAAGQTCSTMAFPTAITRP